MEKKTIILKTNWSSEDTIDEMPFGLEIISAERYPSDMLPKTLANQSRYDIKLTSHPSYYKSSEKHPRSTALKGLI